MSKIHKTTELLFPDGRAHKVGVNGEGMRLAISDSIEWLNDDIDNLMNGVLPDNNGFTAKWCARQERMYGLPAYDTDTLEDRVNRILAHLTPPPPDFGTLSLQSMQDEIDNAGWAGILYVHENLTGLYPHEVLPQLSYPPQLNDFQLGGGQLGTYDYAGDYPQFYLWQQLGNYQLGGGQLGTNPIFSNKIANSLDRFDDLFAILEPMANTFYICGQNLGDIVQIPQSEEAPLRQLLLNIKPLNSVGFLLIEYI